MAEPNADHIREELLSLAGRLFEEGKIEAFLGYGKGSLPFQTTPLIARKKEDLQRISVEDYFFSNLAVYLKEVRGRLGILVKGCDSRSLVSLLQEGQIKREEVYVVGISCPGQIDLRKLARAVGSPLEEVEEIRRDAGEFRARVKGEEKRLPLPQVLLDKCLPCPNPKPLIFDHLLPGDYAAPVAVESSGDPLRQKAGAERWAFWAEQFERCIRCYACRNVCPACFCPRCIVEENLPQWVSPLPTRGDNFVFHLMRLLHVTGTCTSCGECERVCPMEIPLMKLNRKMAEDLKELFDFAAGVDPEKPLPLRTYRQEDPNDFIR
jgi:formate dehydrogenase (coenzyme F420) beta subunit